jgi:hypothetical protein
VGQSSGIFELRRAQCFPNERLRPTNALSRNALLPLQVSTGSGLTFPGSRGRDAFQRMRTTALPAADPIGIERDVVDPALSREREAAPLLVPESVGAEGRVEGDDPHAAKVKLSIKSERIRVDGICMEPCDWPKRSGIRASPDGRSRHLGGWVNHGDAHQSRHECKRLKKNREAPISARWKDAIRCGM